MSLAVLDARETATGVAITFITEDGLEPLEGTHAQVARLAQVMQQVSVISALHDGPPVWIEDVPVGDAVVKLGLGPGGTARVRIVRR